MLSKSEHNLKQPALVSEIKNSHEARLAIFERVTAVINSCYIENLRANSMRDVWDVSIITPYVDQAYNISVNSLQFTCQMGDYNFNYSIAVSLGEVRIGMILPNDLANELERVLILTEAYPATVKDPHKIVRSLPSKGYLIDFIFTSRFADISITKAALQSRNKGSVEIDLLADAIGRELIHINNSVMNALAHQGLLMTVDKIYNPKEFQVIDLYSKDQPVDILERYKLERSQLYIRGRHVYGLLLPNALVNSSNVRARIDEENKTFMANSMLVSQLDSSSFN